MALHAQRQTGVFNKHRMDYQRNRKEQKVLNTICIVLIFTHSIAEALEYFDRAHR